MATDLTTTVQRWTSGAQGAQQKFVDGVRNTTKDPIAAAIAAQGSLVANFSQAVTSGRWARNLSAVGKSGWQAKVEQKANNYSTGIAAGASNYEQSMGTWLPIIQQTADAVNRMPGGSLSNNLAKANAFATALYNRKRGI